MYRIRRFGVVRTSNVVTAMYMLVLAPLFILVGVFGTAVYTRVSTFPGGTETFQPVGPGPIGLLLLLGLTLILYGVLIWVFTALACLVYNFVCRWAGGIEIRLEASPTSPNAYAPHGGWSGPPPDPAGWGAQPPGPYAPWQQPGYQPTDPGWRPAPGQGAPPDRDPNSRPPG